MKNGNKGMRSITDQIQPGDVPSVSWAHGPAPDGIKAAKLSESAKTALNLFRSVLGGGGAVTQDM